MSLSPKASQPIQPFPSEQAESEFNTVVDDFFHPVSKDTTVTLKDLGKLTLWNLMTLLVLTSLQCALHKIEETEANFNPRRHRSWLRTGHHAFFSPGEKTLVSTREEAVMCMEKFLELELQIDVETEGKNSTQRAERKWEVTILAVEVVKDRKLRACLKNLIERLDPFLITKAIGEVKWREVEL